MNAHPTPSPQGDVSISGEVTGDDGQAPGSARTQNRRKIDLRQFGLLGAVILLIVVFAIIAPNFVTAFNGLNVLRQVSIVAVAAVGATMIILIAGIDLSVGSVIAFCGVVTALVLNAGPAGGIGWTVLALVVCIALGALTGLINGFVIGVLHVPAFIATLAGLTAWRGTSLLLTNASPVPLPADSPFTWLGQGYVGPVPVPIVIMALTFFIGYLILNRMKIGRRIYAVGGNATAARLSGVRVTSVNLFVYIFAGACVGLAAAMATARLNSGQPAGFVGLELDVIAAVVVGGTSLMGGYGKLSGTFLGALLIAVLGNGLTLMDVPTYWQQILTGLVILFAVLLDFFVRRKRKAKL